MMVETMKAINVIAKRHNMCSAQVIKQFVVVVLVKKVCMELGLNFDEYCGEVFEEIVKIATLTGLSCVGEIELNRKVCGEYEVH